MEVVIGSKNIPKKLAVQRAFRNFYPDEFLGIQSVTVESGVSSHPVSAEESLVGALNRTQGARTVRPEADFYVGIEGGLSRVGGRAYEHSWVMIENQTGQRSTAVSAGLELSGRLLEAILGGQELGEAFEEQHGVKDAGNRNGLYGMATDDAVTRESATADAVVFALAHFQHPEYFK